jgi:hypothetical protein
MSNPVQIKPPNKYDLAFVRWWNQHGWRLFVSITSKPHLWTHNDATCPFQVTEGMINRLHLAGYLERCFPEGNSLFDEHYHVTKKVRELEEGGEG